MRKVLSNRVCKVFIVLGILVGLFSLIFRFDSRIYYVDQCNADNNGKTFECSLLDENGDAYIIKSNESLKGSWIESKEIGFRFNGMMTDKGDKGVYIVGYDVME